jgi:cyclophilin family peptidyl-prolyl cis-trans isomerase
VPKATKRERQRQNRDARRVEVMEAEKRHKRNKTLRNLGLVLIPIVVVLVIVSLTNREDDNDTRASNNQDETARSFDEAPPQTIDPTAQYTATIETSEGTIVVDLDAVQYPTSVNNFVFLAREKFYDGLLINRVAQDFVIQTGSPTNTTSGGPGYSVVGEVPTTTPAYPVGAVAFAKGGTEPAGTAGSQFFIVTGSGVLDLPPDYAGIGAVSEGLDVAQKIGLLFPASGDGDPTKKVTIETITITETPGTATSTTVAP